MSDIITEYRNENTKDIDLLSTIDIVRKINEETLTPEVFSSRWDLPHEEWGKVVRKEIKKALVAKK